MDWSMLAHGRNTEIQARHAEERPFWNLGFWPIPATWFQESGEQEAQNYPTNTVQRAASRSWMMEANGSSLSYAYRTEQEPGTRDRAPFERSALNNADGTPQVPASRDRTPFEQYTESVLSRSSACDSVTQISATLIIDHVPPRLPPDIHIHARRNMEENSFTHQFSDGNRNGKCHHDIERS
jgi:hypothetical protein